MKHNGESTADGISVLLVDDREDDISALFAIFSELPQVRLVHESSGQAALRALLSDEFALILLDAAMPRVDFGSEHAPVIFLADAGQGRASILRGHEALAAVDFLERPIDPRLLCNKLAIFIELARRGREIRRQIDLRDQAARIREEFLSIASHELRTPVTGIKGYAQLLLRAQARNRLEPARLTRSLQAIDEATDRLTTLTQDLLDVSRIRLGQLPLRLQEIDLTELVRRIGYRYSDQLPARHELIVDLWAPVPPIQGDADRLEQVLSNLLENAIKYSPEGGVVRLELGRSGDEIVLAVRDEGIGLPGDAAESIFRPFGRAPNASARNLPGMGLGLYICQNIVERHGGRIVARSAGEDLGTTFEITLPCPSGVQPETALEPFTVPAATSTPLPA